MSVKPLGLDQSCAMKPKAPLPAMLRRPFEHAGLGASLGTCRRGKYPYFAVSKNTVDIEDYEFNFTSTSSGGWFGHRRDSSRLQPQLPSPVEAERGPGLSRQHGAANLEVLP
jgi:hypothetical protein